MELNKIYELGKSPDGTLYCEYKKIVQLLGEPNVTGLEDLTKVKASWAFSDNQDRKGFIWCYRVEKPSSCLKWSIYGNRELFNELFPESCKWLECI